MTTDQMRCRLAEVYPGPKWQIRCMTMPDEQVKGIYLSMRQENRLKKHPVTKQKEPGIKKAKQLSIFDLPEMRENSAS